MNGIVKQIRDPDDEFIRLYIEDLETHIKSAIKKKQNNPDCELTESEKFCICALAGAQIISHFGNRCCKDNCFRSNNTITHYETYYPCGIIWDGNKFIVGERKIKSFRNVSQYRP